MPAGLPARRRVWHRPRRSRETGRVVEAVHLARRLADDVEQRRTLPNWLGWIRGVAGSALLLEQRRTIGRLGSGQRHLRAGDLRNQQRAAQSQPNWPCFARLCHTHHRWLAQTLGRGAVVVAGCFRAEQKRSCLGPGPVRKMLAIECFAVVCPNCIRFSTGRSFRWLALSDMRRCPS